jgi:hypothetical protein
MKFKLEFDCDNAAFGREGAVLGDGYIEAEIRRLLEVAAQKVDEGNKEGILLDINGNLVGKYKITGRR